MIVSVIGQLDFIYYNHDNVYFQESEIRRTG